MPAFNPADSGRVPSAARLPRRTVLAGAAAAAFAAMLPAPSRAGDVVPTASETGWSIEGAPEISEMARLIHATFASTYRQFEHQGHSIEGYAAGRSYSQIYVRDLATFQEASAYFGSAEIMRTPVEAFLRSQSHFEVGEASTGLIGATIGGAGSPDKATVVSDEESSLVQAAAGYYRAFGGLEWLTSEIDDVSVLDRCVAALDALSATRTHADIGLLFRGNTTDWGDVKAEPGPEPTDLADGDIRTISLFDQAWYFRAAHDLVDMLRAAGRTQDAERMVARASALRTAATTVLFQPDRQYFRANVPIDAPPDAFDRDAIVSVSNALAVWTGFARPSEVTGLFNNVERAAARLGTDRAGLTLYPAFPATYFRGRRMPPGEYQNGAVWDWWGGLQIVSEFEHGRADTAFAHLEAAARHWQDADGIYEWFHVPSQSSQGSADFSGAAGTMAQAVIRGLFGVRITHDGFTLIPRLGPRNGTLDAVRPGGGSLRVAHTAYPGALVIEYNADLPGNGSGAVRLPPEWSGADAFLDGRRVATSNWNAGADTYAGGWKLNSGTHSLVVIQTA